MHTTLHQPIEGAFFRMSFRHYLTVRGYSRDQAKRLVNGIGWDALKAKIRTHGPNLLTVFKSYDFTERPAFVVEEVDFSEFDITIPAFDHLCKENNPDANAALFVTNGPEAVLP